MKISRFIKKIKFFNNEKLKNQHTMKDSVNRDIDHACVETFFDGMGPQTATEIIKRRIDKHIINQYGIEEFHNKGRYYIARVNVGNGKIIHTMLIDKQNGMVRSLYKSAKSK